MSGPYRFSQPDRVTSPLDQRPPNPFPSGQPVSFKTNINRNKTRKWVQAKAFSYDGDDWGDYDEDDEYGVAAHASQNPQAPTGLRQRGQSIDKTGASRSFTEPVQAPASAQAPVLGRRSSFEYGDEKQAFSASLNHAQTMPPPINTSVPGGNGKAPAVGPAPGADAPQQVLSTSPQQTQEPESAQSRISNTSWDPSVVSDSSAYQAPQLRRDFSVSALPPPLQMRPHNTSTPTAPQESPSSRFPPRKSSLSQASAEPVQAGDSAQSTPTASRQRAPSNPNKPLPFIRPADIYKRVEEERRKASMDSERPSLDFVTRPSAAELQSPGAIATGSSDSLDRGHSSNVDRYDGGRGQSLAPLETVAERKSEYLPEFSLVQAEKAAKAESQQATPSQSRPPQISALPDVPVSSFGADFWGSAEKPSTASSSAQQLAEANNVLPQPEVGPSEDTSLHHQPSHGFRTAVRNAFERKDDNSVPATPVSKSNSLSAGGSGVSRSNTDSTAGISPIMSRVPSGANPTSWKRDMENATPAIAEEPAVRSRPASSGTLQQVQANSSLSHSRDGSTSSIPRIGTPTGRRPLGTPSPSQSPAKSPFIEPAKPVPAGESGELSGVGPLDPASPTNFATREADLVSSPSSSNKRTSANMGAEEKQAQTSFLEHRRQSVEASPERASPVSRAESPTKGRVRDLAGKFNEIVSDSRRNSTSSLKSNGSGNKRLSRPSSPTKETAGERPQPEREASFRPKLPGTWESYTTVGQSSPDKEKQEPAMAPVQEREDMPLPTKNNDALGDADITPTTAKHPVDHKDAVDPVHDPMGALAAAGAAIGESIKSAVAPEQRSPTRSEPESWEGSNASDDQPPVVEEERKGRAVGDVYLRPLQLDKTASSIASSSGAPTPNGDREDDSPIKAPPPLRSSRSPSLQPPGLETRDTAQTSSENYSPGPDTSDLATDRLTADIMKRLSTPSLVGSVPDVNRTQTPQPTAQETPKALQETRASSVVPSEYEYYWAAGGEDASGDGSGHNAAPQTTAPESTIRTVEPEGPPAPAGDSSSRPGFLSKKFSWERQEGTGNAAAQASPSGAQAPAASKESASTAPGADSSYFAAAPQPEDHPSVAKAISELPDAPGLHSDGLHIVNPEPELDSSSASGVELEAPAAPNQPLDADAWRAQTTDVDPPSSQPLFSPAQQTPFGAAHQQEQRMPLFREILALKSTDERLAKYHQTREQFAGMDTGLRNWVSTTLANKPEHAELANLPKQPLPPISTTHSSSGGGLMMRHKHNASISHFATGFRKTSQTASGLTSGPGGHDNVSSPTDGGQPSGAGLEKMMQVRGKDLLKGAGVLGGKGMKEAKGLFAKGRSRFRGESKVD
ncbi:putative serine-rich protein [Lasiodiplodia hormozganensis]|uniref:Serine-rich protein n=1 Tax=Lasiodiplodia hormozganensis TaxID=869390 RepID=A0AA39YZM1_9PEZI|nr:putative serine-rich protein [Lasiodiplodia hormozganensis]